MKKIFVVMLLTLVVAVLSGLGNLALAADEVNSVDVKLAGKNYCVACTLGKVGANSSCKASGHKHALKVASAEDSSGKALPDLEGKTIHYLYNTKGKDCAYPGVEVLPDDTIVTTTYGHWSQGEQPYILSVRLKLSELDAKAKRALSSEH